jgi:myo-inositol-1(or 4)-monophosphatase
MDIQRIIEIIRQAGAMMQERNFKVDTKDSISDKVTTLDVKIEVFLKHKLTSLIEGSGFLGEESDPHALNNKYVWVVDPIDGTTNFIRDLKNSAISVALMRNNEIIKGIIYNPYSDEMFWAEQGRGAYLNGDKISVSNKPFNECILMTSLHPYHKGRAHVILDLIMEIYPLIDDTRRTGSAAIDMCLMACGRSDLCFKVILCPWDFAAAALIIEEAGGIVTSLDGGLRYDKNIPIIAANNKENYDKLYKIVEKHYGNN